MAEININVSGDEVEDGMKKVLKEQTNDSHNG